MVLGFVKDTATSTVIKDLKPNESPWDAVGRAITQLVEEGTKLLPLVLENENVIKSEFDKIPSSRDRQNSTFINSSSRNSREHATVDCTYRRSESCIRG